MAVIGSHSYMTPENPNSLFEPAIVVQRYVQDQFVIAVCPIRINQEILPAVLELNTLDTQYNVAENLIVPGRKISPRDIWSQLEINHYALVLVGMFAENKRITTSSILPAVDGDRFTFRFSERDGKHIITIGANFGRTLELVYKHCRAEANGGREGDTKSEDRPQLIVAAGQIMRKQYCRFRWLLLRGCPI